MKFHKNHKKPFNWSAKLPQKTENHNYNILWVDDDIDDPELRPDRDSLIDKGVGIEPISNTDTCIDLINNTDLKRYHCIIVDLSMPIGKILAREETNDGTRTGFALVKKIKERYPLSKIIIYTVVDNAPEVVQYCLENKIFFCNKSTYNSDDFSNFVIDVIKNK